MLKNVAKLATLDLFIADWVLRITVVLNMLGELEMMDIGYTIRYE